MTRTPPRSAALLFAILVLGGLTLVRAGSVQTPSNAVRPYHVDSPWNSPIPSGAPLAPDSAARVATIAAFVGQTLSCDPLQYTYPVYEAAPLPASVVITRTWSFVHDDGTLTRRWQDPTPRLVPIPEHAVPSRGTDGQLIVYDPATGQEWGFWKITKLGPGQWRATSGYRYPTDRDGVAPDGFGSRGAGMPYLAGLVRRWEIDQGRIDHALAIGFRYPSRDFVAPATKSDGPADPATHIPEGARLRLDPNFDANALSGPARVIAVALQKYGAYVVDVSGSAKLYVEDDGTADWNGLIDRDTVAGIPLDRFQLLAPR